MYQTRENLDILFRRVTPEYLQKKIQEVIMGGGSREFLGDENNFFSFQQYDHFAKMNLSQFSRSELELRYGAMKDSLSGELGMFAFRGLYQYADCVLKLEDEIPVVRIDQCLDWNDITSRLGQDIFTTAWLAWKDVKDRRRDNRSLDWSAIIKTDDKRLNTMLKKGLAENHFHLHGSTQSFSLSWVCMMNHPECIKSFFKKNFKENLNISISLGEMDNIGSWSERIKCAAMIRALLFAKCMKVKAEKDILTEYCAYTDFPLTTKIKNYVGALRSVCGEKFEQVNRQKKCLDYVISDYFYDVDYDSNNRLLAGERNFLYRCFKLHFSKELTIEESLLFYLYLVIKSNFRSEIIQVNGVYGFENFSLYQDRKAQFFERFPEYQAEALRLSVCAGIKDNYLDSLEGRIMPKTTAKLMEKEIRSLDHIINFSFMTQYDREQKQDRDFDRGLKERNSFYYIIHFPKKKFDRKEFVNSTNLLPRNAPTRNHAKRCAKALVKYLLQYEKKESRRIKGIDACSLEIGCRPETFATEFRYIRGSVRKEDSEIGITYHVGEDFLDIADGLRAIDETVCFLQLDKGDRLGHAIVLGLEPVRYYELKRNIYWTKQDYLDNVVWMLYRSAELNVDISRNHRELLKDEAEHLIRELYLDNMGKKILKKIAGDILDLYFRSWKLRGDHPDLYKSGNYIKTEECCIDPYRTYMTPDRNREFDRENKVISAFYHLYHYDKQVKLKGLEAKEFEVTDWFAELMENMQKAMRRELFYKGIAIECNPTSNLKIGTFRRHDRHPILTFNNFYLEDDNTTPNLKVSINTDDLGVFDTSLVNEYALMFNAITKKRHREGNFNDDAVYNYLNYIRKNGIEMAFKDMR